MNPILVIKIGHTFDDDFGPGAAVPRITLFGNAAGFKCMSEYFSRMASEAEGLANIPLHAAVHFYEHVEVTRAPFDYQNCDHVEMCVFPIDERSAKHVFQMHDVGTETAERRDLIARYQAEIERVRAFSSRFPKP